MVISSLTTATIEEFEALLENLVLCLENQVQEHKQEWTMMTPATVERRVYETLSACAKETIFDGSIELISGQRFPDIVAKKYYGVEVKTSKGKHWTSLGSSVAEGTRVEGVERIYMFFARLGDSVSFRVRPYEECLSGVVVTHSPRYTIDMDLKQGQTFFDSLGMPYDALRLSPDPLAIVVEHFRSRLKEGETTWWLSSGGSSKASMPVIRLFSSLNAQERLALCCKGYCLFPELLGSAQNKFNRMLLWLSTEESVLVGNLRDQYTAGGKRQIEYLGQVYNVPQILYRLKVYHSQVVELLDSFSENTLREYWNVELERDRYQQWAKLVSEYSKQTSAFPLYDYLMNLVSDGTK